MSGQCASALKLSRDNPIGLPYSTHTNHITKPTLSQRDIIALILLEIIMILTCDYVIFLGTITGVVSVVRGR